MLEDKVLAHIGSSKDELIQLAMDLIRIPTVDPPGKNYAEFSDFVVEWLSNAGLEVEVVAVTEHLDELLQPEASGPRFNILAKLRGSTRRPILHFNGHYDVVPPAAGWSKDPFNPVVEEGRLYGLGATDMKGSLSAMMMAAKALAECDVKLKGDLAISLTPDEEYFSRAGIRYLFDRNLIEADYAIVGEPSGVSSIVVGQKGALWGQITTYGMSAHGSTPSQGVNAFEKLARVAVAIEERLKPRLAKRTSKYRFRPEGENKPTIMLGGMVQGANRNRTAVPEWCSMSFDRRVIPEETLEEAEIELRALLEELEKEDKELKVELELRRKARGFVVAPETEICTSLRESVRQVTGDDPAFAVTAGWTESVYFYELGAQAVVYGPGSRHCAHAEDEYTYVNDLHAASKIYALTILKLLS